MIQLIEFKRCHECRGGICRAVQRRNLRVASKRKSAYTDVEDRRHTEMKKILLLCILIYFIKEMRQVGVSIF